MATSWENEITYIIYLEFQLGAMLYRYEALFRFHTAETQTLCYIRPTV